VRTLYLLPFLTAGLVCAQPAPAPAKAPAPTKAPLPPAADWKMLKYPPLGQVKIPDIPTITLPNGIRLYLLENHELPLVSGFALVRTGNLFDPPGKVGLAQMTGMVMRTGGTASKTGDQLDESLENVAASVESDIGESSGSVSFSCLKENTDQVLEIFKDVLLHPEFRQDKIDLAKTQLRGSIARRNDEASDIVGREFASIVYGKNTPYGWDMNYADIDAIERADLIGFYKRFFFPANIMLAVQGDFDAQEMRARIEKLLGDWDYKQAAVPPFPPVKAPDSKGIYLAVKKDVTQTFFQMGHVGGLFKDPDFPALSVMSEIFGGSFGSRLFTNVRTKLGYAYSIGGGWGATYDHPGLFSISGSTQSAHTVDAIQASLKELERIRTTEVTDRELETAKNTVQNSFVFSFDSPAKTLGRIVRYEYYGYPRDFIFQYQKAVAAVTKADILRVAKARIDPVKIAVVAAGNPDDFGTPLTTLGAVKNIDLTIPEPKSAAVPAAKIDAASIEKGKQLLAKAQAAVGGADKLAAVKDIDMKASSTIQTGQAAPMHVEQHAQTIKPSEVRLEQVLPFGKIIVYYDGKGGWMSTPQGLGSLPPPVIKQIQGQLFREVPEIVMAASRPGVTVAAVGDNSIEITGADGEKTLLELDPSGLPVKQTYRAPGNMGAPATVVQTYSDWKEANGYRYPSKTVIEQNGTKASESVVTDMKVNSGLKSEELSKRP
jgi:zinc protease